MKTQTALSLANLSLSPIPPRVTLGILKRREHEALTELIAQLALRGSFHLIAGSEWLPDQDSLRRSVRRYTTEVNEILEHPILGRPSTYLQMLDQLTSANSQKYPMVVLDFLHFFYDPDIDFSQRQRVLKQCCQIIRHLAQSKSVFVLIQYLPIEEYQLFLPVLTSIADEILETQEEDTGTGFTTFSLGSKVMGRNLLSTTGLAHKLIADLKPLSEMLPPNERRIVENFFEIILQQRVAIAEATDLLPLEAALVILLVEERRRANSEESELYKQIQELRHEIEGLKPEP